jgi:hypothetical protein
MAVASAGVGVRQMLTVCSSSRTDRLAGLARLLEDTQLLQATSSANFPPIAVL